MKKYVCICLIVLSNISICLAETEHCLRCHRMETLAYRDINTHQIVHLYVNPKAYQHSNHKKLECTHCHTADYTPYPHPNSVKQENLYCLECHQDNILFNFPDIESQFKKSVHAHKLNCFSCHDPHQFKVSRVGDDLGKIVFNDNKICVKCHASPNHQWLPNPLLHWRSVRCIDCHQTHEILPAKNSKIACIACHSKNATLLSRLYQYRTQEEVHTKGWFNKAIFNQSYIIGLTRNETIDRGSVIVLLLTIMGLCIHALGRFLTRGKKRLK